MHMRSFISIIKKTRTLDHDVLRAMGIFVGIVIIGSVVYHYLEGWTPLDSVYFSVITLTTIGYGDMYPMTDEAKLFTIFYVLFGVGLVFYLFTTIAKHLFEDEKKEIHRLDKTLSHLEGLLASRRSEKSKK